MFTYSRKQELDDRSHKGSTYPLNFEARRRLQQLQERRLNALPFSVRQARLVLAIRESLSLGTVKLKSAGETIATAGTETRF